MRSFHVHLWWVVMLWFLLLSFQVQYVLADPPTIDEVRFAYPSETPLGFAAMEIRASDYDARAKNKEHIPKKS